MSKPTPNPDVIRVCKCCGKRYAKGRYDDPNTCPACFMFGLDLIAPPHHQIEKEKTT